MVVILMGAARAEKTAIGQALADELGWPLVDAAQPHALDVLQATIADVLGRREHLVITSAPLSARDQEATRGALHGVRFVDLAGQRGNPADIVSAIRREFGL